MTEQLIEAAILLGVGMSVVFAFLTLLIVGVQAIAWFERKFPSPVASLNTTNNNNNKTTQTTVRPNQSNTQNNSNEIVAAISAALHIHRNK